MITKITFQLNETVTIAPEKAQGVYDGTLGYGLAVQRLDILRDHLVMAINIIRFLERNPSHDVMKAMTRFGLMEQQISIRRLTKTTRTYTIPHLWIHEEDK